MTDLLLCILAIYLAPLCYWLAVRYGKIFVVFNRVIIAVVLAYVIFRVLPDSYAGGGVWAIPLIVAGFIIPTIAETFLRKSQARAHALPLFVSFMAFMIHVFIDGNVLALLHTATFTDPSLKWLLILHRIPESFVIWWVTFPLWGFTGSLIAITLIAIVTCVGFFIGGHSSVEVTKNFAWVFQAVLAGSLLHLGMHRQSMVH